MKRVLAGPLGELQETARHIADVSNECKLPLSSDEYVDSFKATLMDVVHAWSKVRLAFSACPAFLAALHKCLMINSCLCSISSASILKL